MIEKHLPACLALLALSVPFSAQVAATSAVRIGCTSPAAPHSLRPATDDPLTFLPDARGVVNVETESVGPVGSWVLESDKAGYRGDGYLRWAGHNLFDTPGVETLSFRFTLAKDTTYLIRLRNRHDHPDPTAENDCWFRLDGGPWEKLVDGWGTAGIGVWSFNAYLHSTGAFPEYDLTAGEHVVELSPRSANFMIDSLHVLPRSVWFANETDPESQRERQRPILGQAFTFEVDDPTDAWGFTPFAARIAAFLAPAGVNAPCGKSYPAMGELLLSPQLGLVLLGTRTWPGPGDPSVFTDTIPLEPSYLGASFTIQALFAEGAKLRLTDGLDLVVGDH